MEIRRRKLVCDSQKVTNRDKVGRCFLGIKGIVAFKVSIDPRQLAVLLCVTLLMPASYTGMQRLAFSSTLGLPQAQTLSHCRTAQRGQRHLRLVCPAGSAVADAPPKRKPGRPKKKVTEEPSPATELSPSTEPSPATEAAAAKPKKTKKSKKTAKPDSDKEEVPVVTAIKAPWDNLSAEEIARQQAELEPLQRAREAAKQEPAGKQKWRARESQYNKFVYRDPAWLEMESKLLTETKFGYVLPLRTGHASLSAAAVSVHHMQERAGLYRPQSHC